MRLPFPAALLIAALTTTACFSTDDTHVDNDEETSMGDAQSDATETGEDATTTEEDATTTADTPPEDTVDPLVCPENTADCDRDASNGCETQTLFNDAHCGACNQSCTTNGEACWYGACANDDRVVSLALGYRFSCALRRNGDAECWGENSSGQLGINSTQSQLEPTRVNTGDFLVEIAAGWAHACAIDTNRELYCWGSNTFGQLGTGDLSRRMRPDAPVDFPDGEDGVVHAVTTGEAHTCAIVGSSRTLYCWGSNDAGQVGLPVLDDPEVVDPTTPTTNGEFAFTDILAVAAGSTHTCAANAQGQVHCWGDNTRGQLGNPTRSSTAVTVESGVAVDVDAGRAHTCILQEDGNVQCWGDNSLNQSDPEGPDDTIDEPDTLSLPAGRTALSLSLGGFHTCAHLDNGDLHCWGDNTRGQLGDNSLASSATDALLSDSPYAASAGHDHTCALLANGEVECWGSNDAGQLGNTQRGLFTTPFSPSLPSTNLTEARLALGARHTCLGTDSNVYCWGLNIQGQLGRGSINNTSNDTNVRVVLPLEASLSDITAGQDHTCVNVSSTNGPQVYCWGLNRQGQLGDGTLDDAPTPVIVNLTTPRPFAQLSASAFYSCGIANDQGYCWGTGGSDIYEPDTPLGTFSGDAYTISRIESGALHSCAISTDNFTLQCWGHNASAQLGTRNVRDYVEELEPVCHTDGGGDCAQNLEAVSDRERAIALGDEHSCAISSIDGDETLFCWGQGGLGQVGPVDADDNLLRVATPITLPENTVPVLVTAGEFHTCVSDSRERIYCFGDNRSGQLATTIPPTAAAPRNIAAASSATPILIPTPADSRVIDLEVGDRHTCALLLLADDTTITLQCWGSNATGALATDAGNDVLVPERVDALSSR